MTIPRIIRLDAALRAAGIPIDGVSGSQGSVRVDYQDSATEPQRTQGAAIVAAFDWSTGADATYAAQQEKLAAAANIDRGALQGGAASDRLFLALAQVVRDEINILRAIASPVQPPRTLAQVVTAIKAKITATAE